LHDIDSHYELSSNKIFVLELSDNKDLICTYNIMVQGRTLPLENTISVHRKKESNTFYTINALNNLIRQLNNDVLDTSFKIDWDNYNQSIILTDNDTGVRIYKTTIFKIIEK